MSKYTPLAEHLKSQVQNSIDLPFAKIDALVDGLPPSARNHDAWWGNSRTGRSHSWAHLWIAAGWECDKVDRVNELVTFHRTSTLPEKNTLGHYWWVNHKKTHRDEFAGGYIWSPKTKRDGTSNQTYTNLTKVRVGDKIISYAEGVVKAIGVVTKLAAEAPIPKTHWEAAECWGESGWEVIVEWLPLPNWVKPKDFINRIAPLLPKKHSPLRQSGDGNQGCYLTAISDNLGKLIIQLAVEVDATAIQIAHELQIECQEAIETRVLDAADLTETEREQLSRARIGQGVFRQRVAKVERRCRVTGVANLAFLVASHIKPWRDCDNEERLNGNNGLLLSPHVDRLFDRGWISFTDKGVLMVAPGAVEVVKAWNLPQNCMSGKFNANQKGFLAYHRAKVFLCS